jgi:predicted nicotinamide N-methyase
MNFEPPTDRPPLPQTPLDALGPPICAEVIVEDRTFAIYRPSESDKLLDHPAVHAAFAADEYLPYWADLWPAARMLAKAIVREPWAEHAARLGPLTALEVGCGLGLPGVAAMSAGLRVVFSDCDAAALRFAADNAQANGLFDYQTLQLDWRFPPAGAQFPVLLGSDLIYEVRNVAPLVGLIRKMMHPDGLCLLTDQDRVPSHVLRDTLAAEGLPFTTHAMRAGEPGGRRVKGTLYRIRKR